LLQSAFGTTLHFLHFSILPRSSTFAVEFFFVTFRENEKLVLLAADENVILASDINLLLDFNRTKDIHLTYAIIRFMRQAEGGQPAAAIHSGKD